MSGPVRFARRHFAPKGALRSTRGDWVYKHLAPNGANFCASVSLAIGQSAEEMYLMVDLLQLNRKRVLANYAFTITTWGWTVLLPSS